MINYSKVIERLKEKGINTYAIRQLGIIPQGTYSKIKMCSGSSWEEIEKKLEDYKNSHDSKDFVWDVSTKTIEDLCQLLQCQPYDLIEWKVNLDESLSYESKYLNKK